MGLIFLKADCCSGMRLSGGVLVIVSGCYAWGYSCLLIEGTC